MCNILTFFRISASFFMHQVKTSWMEALTDVDVVAQLITVNNNKNTALSQSAFNYLK